MPFLERHPSRVSCASPTDQAIGQSWSDGLGSSLGRCGPRFAHIASWRWNLALRQQLALWKVRRPRPRLTAIDRIFWVILSRRWKSWRSSLRVVRPETVVGWHRAGIQALLSVEESTPTRSARNRDGAPRADSADEPRQPSLGRAEDPW